MMKKLFLKSNPLSLNNNSNNQANIDKIPLKSNEKEPKLNNSFLENRNNITVDFSKNYPLFKSPIELPKISGTKKNYGLNKSKLSGIKHIMLSNSSKNIYSQNMMGMPSSGGNKFLRRDKTHSILIKEEDSDNDLTNDNININNISLNNIYKNNGDMALFKRKIKNTSNKNINNITNINIHIHSNENQINNNIIYRNSNTQSLAKKKQNITSRDLVNKHDTLTSNKNIFNSDNKTIETLSNINPSKNNIINTNSNNIMNNSSNNPLLQRNNNVNIRILKKKNFQKNQRIGAGHSSSVEANNKGNALSIVGNIIINNNKINSLNRNNRSNSKETNNYYNNKIAKNSLPEISLTQIEGINKKIIEEKYNFAASNKGKNKTLIEVLEEYEEIDILDLEKINEINEFLENLCEKKEEELGVFLKILQTHLDIELLFNSLNIKKTTIKNYKNNNSNINNLNNNMNNNNNNLKQKMQICISNEKQYRLFNLLLNYFNFLSEIYTYNYITRIKYLQKELQNDFCFFQFQVLNNLFKNSIKTQICLYSSIFISLSHLAIFDFNLVLKNYFFKIFKEVSYSLYNIFEFFIKPELQKNYSTLIENNLRSDFFENYEKVIKEYKITENKNREIIKTIINNINKVVNSLKFYSSSNLKYSLIKPYGDALNQLLFSFERKSLIHFSEIFLRTILYEQLEANRKINLNKSDILFTKRNTNTTNPNEITGSGIINNIKESPPYLPEINPKYKYTLVLDIDETIIHYFFTYINGMFFVRPYVYEFLNELSQYYEIVTFTAGTKDYADNILNLLDTNDNLIKYRLYRHHTTIMGCNVFKDLMRLGRDMSKIIIIDNLKDNFKLQPNNGLFIKTWTSDINDNQLYDLEKILKDIALFEVEDVRPVIEKINDYIKITRNMINPFSCIDIRKILESIDTNKT